MSVICRITLKGTKGMRCCVFVSGQRVRFSLSLARRELCLANLRAMIVCLSARLCLSMLAFGLTLLFLNVVIIIMKLYLKCVIIMRFRFYSSFFFILTDASSLSNGFSIKMSKNISKSNNS